MRVLNFNSVSPGDFKWLLNHVMHLNCTNINLRDVYKHVADKANWVTLFVACNLIKELTLQRELQNVRKNNVFWTNSYNNHKIPSQSR